MGMMETIMGIAATARPGISSLPGAKAGRYDRVLDAVNRLPRPLMAISTLVMFADAMLDPAGFARRMTALQAMPEQLWWLAGGIITFYFGARETHYLRKASTQAENPDTKA